MPGSERVAVELPETLDLPMTYFDWTSKLPGAGQGPAPAYIRNPEMMTRAVLTKLQNIRITHTEVRLALLSQPLV